MPRRNRKNYKAVVVRCVTRDTLPMRRDFQAMVNHLISWGLHSKIHDKFDMWKETKVWFDKTWRPKYLAHYHEAACAYASQQLQGWKELGGNTSSLPYLKKPLARLRQDLFELSIKGEDLTLRVKLAPRQPPVLLQTRFLHGKRREYLKGDIGEVTIGEGGIILAFGFENARPIAKKLAGVDLNLSEIFIAREDGKILTVDISHIMNLQQNERKVRRKISMIIKNPQKRAKVLKRRKGRERNRTKQRIYDLRPAVQEKLGDHAPVFEDLKTLTPKKKKKRKGVKKQRSKKAFRARLSSWVRGEMQRIFQEASPFYPVNLVYAPGTSSFCPFCGSRVTHPEYLISQCPTHGDFHRDALAAVAILVRGKTAHIRRKKNDPWPVAKDCLPPDVVASLEREAHRHLFRSKRRKTPGLAAGNVHDFKGGLWGVPAVDGGLSLNAFSSGSGEVATPAMKSVGTEQSKKIALTSTPGYETKKEGSDGGEIPPLQ